MFILLGGDAKLIKHHEVFVACKKNNYMFLTTDKFKFLDIKNFFGHGMSYDKRYEKISYVDPLKRQDFYSSLTIKNIL